MILVDMNQISLASVMMHLHMTKNTEPDDNMVRHMILNSLRMYRTRFSSEYGELVLVNGENPNYYLIEHVFKGDSSDGVPNVLSPDNTFTDGLRQKPLGKKKISSWADHEFKDVAPNDEVMRNYQRNKKLIDLTECPKELRDEILDKYRSVEIPDRSKLLNYFVEKRLKSLTDSIGEF